MQISSSFRSVCRGALVLGTGLSFVAAPAVSRAEGWDPLHVHAIEDSAGAMALTAVGAVGVAGGVIVVTAGGVLIGVSVASIPVLLPLSLVGGAIGVGMVALGGNLANASHGLMTRSAEHVRTLWGSNAGREDRTRGGEIRPNERSAAGAGVAR